MQAERDTERLRAQVGALQGDIAAQRDVIAEKERAVTTTTTKLRRAQEKLGKAGARRPSLASRVRRRLGGR